MIEWCLQEHSVGAFCRSMRRRFHKGDSHCSVGRLFFVHYSFARRSFATFLYLRPMTTCDTEHNSKLFRQPEQQTNRINPKITRTAPRTIMRIPANTVCICRVFPFLRCICGTGCSRISVCGRQSFCDVGHADGSSAIHCVVCCLFGSLAIPIPFYHKGIDRLLTCRLTFPVVLALMLFLMFGFLTPYFMNTPPFPIKSTFCKLSSREEVEQNENRY